MNKNYAITKHTKSEEMKKADIQPNRAPLKNEARDYCRRLPDFMRFSIIEQMNKLKETSSILDVEDKIVFYEELIYFVEDEILEHIDSIHSGMPKETCLYEQNGHGFTYQIKKEIEKCNAELGGNATQSMLPKLFWNGSKNDLVELALVLSHLKLITNEDEASIKQDIIHAFELLFKRKIKHPSQSTSQFKSREDESTALTYRMHEAYKKYISEKED